MSGLVEEGGIIAVELLEDRGHEHLADELAAVMDQIALAVALQGAHLAVIEQKRHPVVSDLFGAS